MSRPVDAVISFLENEKAHGRSHVYLDEEARESLRNLLRRSKQQTAQAAAKPAATTPQPGQTSQPRQQPAQPAQAPATLSATGTNKTEKLASLRARAEHWQPARSLGTLRDTMVFATGNPDARILLVGEAPGHHEENKREPFVGPAGQMLDKILITMGLKRDDVYISNIVKFRPATPRQTTNNRKPTPQEIAACLPFIREEVAIVQPECIIALGGTAAEGLLGLEGPVGKMRGTWHEFSGIPTRVTYHPSYLLQSGSNLSVKRALWEDMLAAMEKLDMPISEKQRGFFLPKP